MYLAVCAEPVLILKYRHLEITLDGINMSQKIFEQHFGAVVIVIYIGKPPPKQIKKLIRRLVIFLCLI